MIGGAPASLAAMRLVIDMTVARQAPHAGTARYAREVLSAMTAAPPPGGQIFAVGGWPRLRSGERMRPLRRVANLGVDVGWLTTGALAAAARRRADAWFGPANLLPPTLPRPMIVTIHDVNFLTVPGSYDRGYTRYATRMFTLSARRAARVVTGSQAARNEVVARLEVDPRRVSVVHPGADVVPLGGIARDVRDPRHAPAPGLKRASSTPSSNSPSQ